MSPMFVAIVAALMLIVGAPVEIVGVVLAFSVSPWLAVGMVGVVAVGRTIASLRKKGRAAPHEGDVLRDLAAAVSAGSSLRQAVASSRAQTVSDRTRRLCAVGAPMRSVAESMDASLPALGREFAAVAALSESAGASIGPALRLLAAQADELEQFGRDQRVAVAQAKFSAVVVGVVPLSIALVITILRGIPEPGGASVVIPMVVGSALMAVGAGIVFVVANRAVQ